MLIEITPGRIPAKNTSSAPVTARGTCQNSLPMALVEGEGDEATRAGQRFHIGSSGATGIAPVQALPTTAASWLLYNPASNPNTVWFDILAEWLVSGTAGAGASVLFALITAAQLPATRPSASSAGIVLQNANPACAKTSRLIVVASQTLLASPAISWSPMAVMNPANTTLGQTFMEQRDLRGKIGLGPDTGVALAVISPAGVSPLFAPYGSYREYASDME